MVVGESRSALDGDTDRQPRPHLRQVPAETVQRMIEENRFGDRWPSSGLITIVHTLATKDKV